MILEHKISDNFPTWDGLKIGDIVFITQHDTPNTTVEIITRVMNLTGIGIEFGDIYSSDLTPQNWTFGTISKQGSEFEMTGLFRASLNPAKNLELFKHHYPEFILCQN